MFDNLHVVQYRTASSSWRPAGIYASVKSHMFSQLMSDAVKDNTQPGFMKSYRIYDPCKDLYQTSISFFLLVTQ